MLSVDTSAEIVGTVQSQSSPCGNMPHTRQWGMMQAPVQPSYWRLPKQKTQQSLPLLLLQNFIHISKFSVNSWTIVCLVNKYLKILYLTETNLSSLLCCFGGMFKAKLAVKEMQAVNSSVRLECPQECEVTWHSSATPERGQGLGQVSAQLHMVWVSDRRWQMSEEEKEKCQLNRELS